MLDLMRQEGISAPRTAAQVCNDGFELAVLMGDRSEVQVWAHMSYEAHRHGWGEDYPMTRRMKHFVQNPPVPAATGAPAEPESEAPAGQPQRGPGRRAARGPKRL